MHPLIDSRLPRVQIQQFVANRLLNPTRLEIANANVAQFFISILKITQLLQVALDVFNSIISQLLNTRVTFVSAHKIVIYLIECIAKRRRSVWVRVGAALGLLTQHRLQKRFGLSLTLFGGGKIFPTAGGFTCVSYITPLTVILTLGYAAGIVLV